MFTLLNSYNDYHILSKIYFSIKILSFVNLILPTYPRIIRESKCKLNIQRNLLVGKSHLSSLIWAESKNCYDVWIDRL